MAEAHQAHHEDHGHHMEEGEKGLHVVHSSKKEIWKVFAILLGITLLEFLIALTHSIREALGKGPVVGIFLFLTVLKAFYIVGNFMHLKHERINMIYTILLTIMFIIYLIVLLMIEGGADH